MTLEKYLENNYSKSAYNSHRCVIQKYLNFIQEKAKTAQYQDVLNYVVHLRKNKNLASKTIKHYLGGVKIYYQYLQEIGERVDHPCSRLYLKDQLNKQVQVDQLYSMERLERFLEEAEKEPNKTLRSRNQVIISLLIYQGLTVKEISDLEVADIDLVQAKITIQSNDPKKARVLSLKAKQILLILNYLEENRPVLIKQIQSEKPIKKLITGKLKEKIRPNMLNEMINERRDIKDRLQPLKIRQSVIANLLKKGNDTRIVQVFAGHRRASTTLQYKQNELESLKKAINEFHPLQ